MSEHDKLQERCRNLMQRLEGICLGLRASGSESAAEVASIISEYIWSVQELDCSHSRRTVEAQQGLPAAKTHQVPCDCSACVEALAPHGLC